ncbi:hypothetical protein IPA_05150 [Ignicoccus pacificus DSM 13166]|uniref:Uncharacterized protein n=1 Tax=Ignicoccus pacificus DSM 13166 TaxID=940294 RepID=A0A977PKX4_9CREN|nr:hypothetical protein IPA_05150 [Ignicoccus pacificus DSM 13166]
MKLCAVYCKDAELELYVSRLEEMLGDSDFEFVRLSKDLPSFEGLLLPLEVMCQSRIRTKDCERILRFVRRAESLSLRSPKIYIGDELKLPSPLKRIINALTPFKELLNVKELGVPTVKTTNRGDAVLITAYEATSEGEVRDLAKLIINLIKEENELWLISPYRLSDEFKMSIKSLVFKSIGSTSKLKIADSIKDIKPYLRRASKCFYPYLKARPALFLHDCISSGIETIGPVGSSMERFFNRTYTIRESLRLSQFRELSVSYLYDVDKIVTNLETFLRIG